jgi:hypothetical protein
MTCALRVHALSMHSGHAPFTRRFVHERKPDSIFISRIKAQTRNPCHPEPVFRPKDLAVGVDFDLNYDIKIAAGILKVPMTSIRIYFSHSSNLRNNASLCPGSRVCWSTS